MKFRKRFITVVAVILALLMLFSVVASVLSSLAYAVSQSDIDALQEQKAALREEQEQIQAEIEGLQSEQATVLEQKAALDAQNELARQEIELINEQIDIYDQLIENKSNDLDAATAAQEEQTEKYRARIRAMEEQGTTSYLAILFEATSFSDFLSRLDVVFEIMERDYAIETELIDLREATAQAKAEYEETRTSQEGARVELLERKAELETQIDAACELIAEIETNIEAHQADYLANEEAENQLDSEINELIAELEAQRLAEEEAKRKQEQAANGGQTGGTAAGQTPSGEAPSGMFIWPTTGYTVSSPWGYRTHPIFGTQKFHSGIDIAVNANEPIYAAASGTVVTAMNSSSYGNYVMISHGNGYYTLYAHMTEYIVTNGQTVSQGDVIGYVGSTGWSTGPHLHFEVRVNGSTIDPESCF